MIARLFIACLFLFGAADLSAQSRYEIWQQDRPFTVGAMFYDYHQFPEARGETAQLPAPVGAFPTVDLMRKAGLNMFCDVSFSNGGHKPYPGVSSVQEGGIEFMILGAGWGQAPLENFKSHVQQFADNPNWSGFCGVQLADEPHHDPEDPERYRPQRDWLVETYPHLLTTFCEDLSGYEQWEHEWDVIRSDAIIFQWYPYHTNSGNRQQVQPGMFALLERASKFCQSKQIGFFVARETEMLFPESVYRMATYVALAHGAQGFIDWAWDDMGGDPKNALGYATYFNGVEQGSRPFEIMSKINREVANLGPTLLKLRHVRTYQMDITSGNTWAGPIYHFSDRDDLRTGRLRQLAPKDQPVGVHTPLLVGFFRDAKSQEYFMVVNKRNSRHHKVEMNTLAQQVTMTFVGSVDAIERLNRETGEVERIEIGPDHTYTFTLPAGTGDLFRYASDTIPFVGVE